MSATTLQGVNNNTTTGGFAKKCWAAENAKTLKEENIQIFGAGAWQTYFGDVGDEPPLPKDFMEQLLQACPLGLHFDYGATIGQTHVVALVPSHVNGHKLTVERLGEIVKDPFSGGEVPHQYKGNCADKSYWVLMSKDLLDMTRKYSYSEQLNEVAGLGSAYRAPKLIEALVCLFAHHAQTGKALLPFSDRLFTSTRCQESDNNCHVIVGNYRLEPPKYRGLCVNLHPDSSNIVSVGLAVVRSPFAQPTHVRIDGEESTQWN